MTSGLQDFTTSRLHDVAVVGAGPAGSATARLLGDQGFSVLLFDRADFPREKVCGEGLMPSGVEFLRRHGLLSTVLDSGARLIDGLEFFIDGLEPLRLEFSDLGPDFRGLVATRWALDDLCVHWARECPEVNWWPETRITGVRRGRDSLFIETEDEKAVEFQVRAVVGADGAHSLFHRQLGLKRREVEPRRFALRALFDHFESDGRFVEVHCGLPGEAYVAPLEGGRARVTLLLLAGTARLEPGELRRSFAAMLDRFPRLRGRLSPALPEEPVETAAPLSLRIDCVAKDRLLLAGDAAGMIDPITGQGISMAFRDAELIADLLGRQLRSDRLDSAGFRDYEQRRNATFEPSFKLARHIIRFVHRPVAARRAFRVLQRDDGLRRKLLAAVCGIPGDRCLSIFDQLRLMFGI